MHLWLPFFLGQPRSVEFDKDNLLLKIHPPKGADLGKWAVNMRQLLIYITRDRPHNFMIKAERPPYHFSVTSEPYKPRQYKNVSVNVLAVQGNESLSVATKLGIRFPGAERYRNVSLTLDDELFSSIGVSR